MDVFRSALNLMGFSLFCSKLAEAMSITGHLTDLKAATVLDYYVAAFWWGKEQNFNVEQLSSFFTVVHTLLENIKGELKLHPQLI